MHLQPEYVKAVADALKNRSDNPLVPADHVPVPLGGGIYWWISQDRYERLRTPRKPLMQRYGRSR